MFDWLRELLEIGYEFRERKTKLFQEDTACESCITLRQQLEISNFEKKQLLERILEKPVVEEHKEPPMVTVPRAVPWAVRKQILEAEDREKFRLQRDAPKPISTEDLEKELNVATAEREAKASRLFF